MEHSKKHRIKVAVLTVSTSCFEKELQDKSGEVLAGICRKNGFLILSKDIVSDDKRAIGAKLAHWFVARSRA